jgi:ATP-binding cassette subfamily B protein
MLVLLAIPLIVVPLVLSGRGVRRRSRAAQDRLADASAYAAEAVGAVRTMQAFGMEQATAARFADAAEQAFAAARASTAAALDADRDNLTSSLSSANSRRGVVVPGPTGHVAGGPMSAGRLSQLRVLRVFAASQAHRQLSEI